MATKAALLDDAAAPVAPRRWPIGLHRIAASLAGPVVSELRGLAGDLAFGQADRLGLFPVGLPIGGDAAPFLLAPFRGLFFGWFY